MGARKIAQGQGLIRYFSGKPCVNGHVSQRYTRNGACVDCEELRWRSGDKASNAARVRKYYKSNRQKCISRSIAYAKAHREQINTQSKICKLAWDRRNQKYRNSVEAKRRATKLQATPSWADLEVIRDFYKNCPDGHHVDHIVPLKGKNVSGLHVIWNLQYLPALDNIRKGNKLTVG